MTYTRLYNSIRNLLSPRQLEDDEPYDDEEDTGAPERGDIEQLDETGGLPATRQEGPRTRRRLSRIRVPREQHTPPPENHSWRTGKTASVQRGTTGTHSASSRRRPTMSVPRRGVSDSADTYRGRFMALLQRRNRMRRSGISRRQDKHVWGRGKAGTKTIFHRVKKSLMRKLGSGGTSSANPRNRPRRVHQHVKHLKEARLRLLEAAGRNYNKETAAGTKMDTEKILRDWFRGDDPKRYPDTDPNPTSKRESKNATLIRDLDTARKTPGGKKIDLKPGMQE